MIDVIMKELFISTRACLICSPTIIPISSPILHCSLLFPAILSQMAQVASTRWYPTPEQLTILRTMYRGGVRSLSGSQIQQMAAYLSLYGRIEAKNVFYWFQNRKARDRQKLRRRLTKQHTKTASSAAHVLLQQQSFHPQVQTWFARSHPLHHQAQAFPVSQVIIYLELAKLDRSASIPTFQIL